MHSREWATPFGQDQMRLLDFAEIKTEGWQYLQDGYLHEANQPAGIPKIAEKKFCWRTCKNHY